jgi:predicted O-methyltransferase YrrM
MPRQTTITPALLAYAVGHGQPLEPFLTSLRQETARLPGAGMQIGEDQGQLMRLLVGLLGARRAIEVGVYTGYSALCVALALSEDGVLVGCDINPETTQVARRYFALAGIAHKFDLRLAPALDTLDELLADDSNADSFDVAFMDADKENYPAYYDRLVRLVRPGGLLMVDNTLWGGSVLDDADDSAPTRAIRQLNHAISRDPRVDACLVPIGDGLMLARKR